MNPKVILIIGLVLGYIVVSRNYEFFAGEPLQVANFIPDDTPVSSAYTKNVVQLNETGRKPVKFDDPFEEVKTLYGHSKTPYDNGILSQPPVLYPTKRQIDTLGGNHWMPVLSEIRDDPEFNTEPTPLNVLDITQKNNKNIQNSGIHAIKDIRFLVSDN